MMGMNVGMEDSENNNHTNSIISFQLLTYLNNFLLFNFLLELNSFLDYSNSNYGILQHNTIDNKHIIPKTISFIP